MSLFVSLKKISIERSICSLVDFERFLFSERNWRFLPRIFLDKFLSFSVDSISKNIVLLCGSYLGHCRK